MANDLATMQTEVWGWTDTNTDRLPAVYITRITNGIIADLARSADSLFNEFEETITTTSGDNDYPLSSLTGKFSRPFSMWFTTSSGTITRVEYVSPEEFEHRYQNSSETGEPLRYTIYNNDILIGPTPNGIYELTFKYYGTPADLSSGTDTNNYLAYAWDVILYGVLGEVCKFLLEDNRVPMFFGEYQSRRKRFLIEHARARSAGKRSASHEPGWLD